MTRVTGILLLLGFAGGCSDRPREIREAKPVKTDAADVTVELPKTPPPAASDPGAAAVLKDAIAAHTGGKPELLEKLRSVSYTRDGSTLSPPMTPMTWMIRGKWPEGYRADVDMPGQPRMSICRTGAAAWQYFHVTGMTKQMLSGDPVKGVIADGTYESLAVLAPLADPDLVAAPAPDRTVMDRPAAGVWLTGKNLPSVVVHFDKETKRLAQFTYT
ncbi:MAG: hypothetical protein ACRC7O_11410, partial [Fimbriiglobus sp.]